MGATNINKADSQALPETALETPSIVNNSLRQSLPNYFLFIYSHL